MTSGRVGYVAGMLASMILFAAYAAEKSSPMSVILTLQDGSIIVGTPSDNALKIKTATGEINVALDLVGEIRFETNSSVRIMFRNEDRISGTIQKETMELTTLFGKCTIPMGLVTSIQVRSGKGEIPSERKQRGEKSVSACSNNLRLIEAAKDNYAIDYGGTNGTVLTWKNLELYIKDINRSIYCPGCTEEQRSPEASYDMGRLGVDVKCRIFPELHTLTTK